MESQKTSQRDIERIRPTESNKPVLDRIAQSFLDQVSAAGGKPIYKLAYAEAREVLENEQKGKTSPVPVDIEDRVFPVGPSKEVSVRIFRPRNAKGSLPAVMYFHGGGWVLGSKNTHDRLVRELTDQTQAAFVFVNYTPSPEAQYPVPLEECYAATLYVAEHGSEFGLDGSRLAVAGDSAGGNLAAAVAILCKQRSSPQLSFQALLYPVTDADFETESYQKFADGYWLSKAAMEWFWDAYVPRIEDRDQITASPLRADLNQLKNLPPALVITDENDVLRDEGEAYARKLIEAGVSVTVSRSLATIHDFAMLNALAETTATRSAISLMAGNLRAALSRSVH
ncbi:alpha/beta hydrolase [Bdellovibrio sp. HCB2-146]|uniref:alpha/beta hydrolase n=1 Tax=Bdellovibrio sp. HCB2-146 TaxID=3394362 RepID=UPI0039BC5EB7